MQCLRCCGILYKNQQQKQHAERIFYEKTLYSPGNFIFLLSGCSHGEVVVNNPYEVAKGASILSYYDTEDNISIDSFKVLEWGAESLIGLTKQYENCIIVREGQIRYISIIDEDIVTYKQISVGDDIDKIEKAFSQIDQYHDIYTVFFNDEMKEDTANLDREDTWISISYLTDGEKIIKISISDIKFARKLQ